MLTTKCKPVRLLALVLSAALLAACSVTQAKTDETAVAAAPEKEAHGAELRVAFHQTCPVHAVTREGVLSTIGLSIVSDVVGKLAGSAIDALGDYLTTKQAVTFSDSTRMDGFLGAENAKLVYNKREDCLIIVVAKSFGEPMPASNYDPLPGIATSPGIKKSIYDATKLSGPALFYMEMAPLMSGGTKGEHTAFTYVPTTFYYPSFITPAGWKYQKNRDVLLRLEIAKPGESAPFGAFEWRWNGISSGSISEAAVTEKKISWSPLPDGISAAAGKVKTAGINPVFPVNVKVMLTETAEPHVILKYLGDAIKAQKDNVVKEAQGDVSQALSVQARVAARQAAATDVGKRYDDYVAAYDAASTAQDKYQAAAAGATKQKALVAAKLAYAKLNSAETMLGLVYSNAGLGAFDPLPALPALP